MKQVDCSVESHTCRYEIQLEGEKMKNLSLFTIVIALCLSAAAMIQSGHGSNGWHSSKVDASRVTSAPFRDGLYLGKLAAERGESHISSGRWATEADRAAFAAGFREGYHDELVLRASKGSTN
jgi:hypothetical protein